MFKKLTTNEFIYRAKESHGERWSYDETTYVNKRTKIKFWCKKHGYINQFPANHLKIGCPFCSTGRHNTHSFVLECQQKYEYDYSETIYKNNKTKIEFICQKHGRIKQLPNEHLAIGCPKCAKKREMISKHTPESVLKRAREVHGDKYSYPNLNFKDIHDEIPIICKKHGEFPQRIYAHINEKQGCSKCGYENRTIANRKETKEFIIESREIFGNLYDYSGVVYKSRKKHVLIECPIHGIFKQLPYLHLKGHGCHFCSDRGISKYDRESYIKRANEVHGDRYDYSKVELNCVTDRIIIICKNHGEFPQKASAHINSRAGCPDCAAELTTSVAEKEIKSFIESFYGGEVLPNIRSIIPNMEIDVYLPELALGFEYHGLYWHSESRVGRRHHSKKANLSQEKKIQLIQIFEHEWRDKQDILHSIIKNKVGITKNKIHARKTKLIHLSNSIKNEFLDRCHIQGHDIGSSIRLGLEYDGKLVACMTFGKSRFRKDFDWELMRYCCQLNTVVVGGASKLFSYFKKNYDGTIISFADRRFSNGGMYMRLGFQLDGISDPGYFYFKNKFIRPRMQCQKHKLKGMPEYSDSLSEYEIMRLNGYDRVWDAGNYRFVFV
jgi:Zn finger protein HypA/HybF involved in hydrogenase expression